VRGLSRYLGGRKSGRGSTGSDAGERVIVGDRESGVSARGELEGPEATGNERGNEPGPEHDSIYLF
jgi:hypothetical protein